MCYFILSSQSFVDVDEIGMVPSVLLKDVKKNCNFPAKNARPVEICDWDTSPPYKVSVASLSYFLRRSDYSY